MYSIRIPHAQAAQFFQYYKQFAFFSRVHSNYNLPILFRFLFNYIYHILFLNTALGQTTHAYQFIQIREESTMHVRA